MLQHLKEEFSKFIGQPMKIFMVDGRTHTGIILEVFANNVRIINDCGKLMLIEFAHITAVEEPQLCLSIRESNPIRF